VAQRVVQTSKRLSAQRQIHAAIVHCRDGDFECAISLCSAAENQMPEPSEPILQRAGAEYPPPPGQKDNFNCVANWMKHWRGADEVEIEEWNVTMWLNRAISKYRAVYGVGTPNRAFSWGCDPGTDERPTAIFLTDRSIHDTPLLIAATCVLDRAAIERAAGTVRAWFSRRP
jgi:hypothetical protein